MTAMDRGESPAARADALVRRLFEMLHECRALLPMLAESQASQESPSAPAERLMYFALLGALEAGLVRTMKDAMTVLRQASAPLGPMGEEWLQSQEALLDERAREEGT
jgi:hypothetical protein